MRSAFFIVPFVNVCRETALLVDLEDSSLSSKKYVALTMAHEVSHMWLDNLVTMSWWTDLWLIEGFAMWAECLAVDHCFLDYDIWVSCPSYCNLWWLKWVEVEIDATLWHSN